MDEELDTFKQWDLRSYAVMLGYTIDRRESSRSSTVMRRDHDKIIVSRKSDGHYTYWSPRDEADRGTIIDFVQKRKKCSLGEVRKELRSWASRPAPEFSTFAPLSKTVKDLAQVRQRYAAMSIAHRHPYLEEERRIPAEILRDQRFEGRIRIDRYGAAVFPHTDSDGKVCGYELKNKGGFTGFASGGRKGVFLSNSSAADRRLVITESAIDALSHFVLFGDLHTRYASIAGKPTPAQHAIIRGTMITMPQGAEIVAATDADDAGEQLAARLGEIYDECGRADLRFRRDTPEGSKDWNDLLRAGTELSPLPSRFRIVSPLNRDCCNS